jgi:DNA-binding NtrC family response regulator
MWMANILLVDPEEKTREDLSSFLIRMGHSVTSVDSIWRAEQVLEREIYDLLICEEGLPDGKGLDLLRYAKAISPETEIIIISSDGTIEKAVEAIKEGALDYLPRPFHPQKIAFLIERVMENRKVVEENRELRKELDIPGRYDLVIGKSKAMQDLMNIIRRVAPTDSTVLIIGESGTGKELVARAIHRRSKRAKGPFKAINCGAIPEQLWESELFGHVRGAFTGAISTKRGIIEEADGGTLFLDEIAEIPPHIQVKLLRFLQERRIRRVGDTKEIEVDTRIIAATNRDLKEEIRAGRFREDLYYRLNVITIFVPPLRERPEDISFLALYFLYKYRKELSKDIWDISKDAMQMLLSYHWPGNVRELENVIQRAVILADGNIIMPKDLPQELALSGYLPSSSKSDRIKTLKEVEAEYISEVIRLCNGNMAKAAKLLGISRSSLYRKVKGCPKLRHILSQDGTKGGGEGAEYMPLSRGMDLDKKG